MLYHTTLENNEYSKLGTSIIIEVFDVLENMYDKHLEKKNE